MCRMAGYLGVPRTLDALLYDAPRSLEVQAYDPHEQQHGNVNVDGTGAAWWPDAGPGPLRYATTQTPWADDNLRTLAPHLRARAMIAAVRGATPGIAGGRAAVAPFTLGDLAIGHNGWLGGFHEHVAPQLLAELPPAWVGHLDVLSDSLLLALHIASRRTRDGGLLETVATAVQHVADVCAATGQPATLNLIVSDGRTLVATRAAVAGTCNSLYLLTDREPPWSDGVLIASEPLDDRPWEPVPPDHIIEVAPWRDPALSVLGLPGG